jgi:hypothetical protein
MMPMKTIRMMLVSAISDNWVVVLDFLIDLTPFISTKNHRIAG